MSYSDVMEPGVSGHNAPKWICLSRTSFVAGSSVTNKDGLANSRGIDVIMGDGRVDHCKSKKEVIKKYHVDKAYLNKYINDRNLSIKKRGMIFIDRRLELSKT